ncbi:MAG: SPOR domain-containing protein [Burkholderiales bacterium]|nr:SPOR domain-containing protein [Burkholderiales bacterium]
MLKFFFWVLLLANAGLFAYHQGYFSSRAVEKREPEINADKIKVLPAGVASAAAKSASVAPAASAPEAAEVAEKKSQALQCLEIGNFAEADAKRFETQLAALSLGNRMSKRNIQEAPSHLVFIPTQGNKELAEKKSGELRRLGITDFFIIQDNPSLRWAISLGVFSTEEAAKNRLTDLSKQGVRTARIGLRNNPAKLAFQLHDVDVTTKEKLDQIKTGFSAVEEKNCSAVAFN